MGHEKLVHDFDQTSMIMWATISCQIDEKKARKVKPLQFNPYRQQRKALQSRRPMAADIGVGSDKAFALMKKAFT